MSARSILIAIMSALVVWGVIHAIGAYRGADPIGANLLRGAIVVACFTGFLGMWAIALWLRERREARRQGRRK